MSGRFEALENKVSNLSEQLSQLIQSNRKLAGKINGVQRKEESKVQNDTDMLNFMQVKETKLKSLEENMHKNRYMVQKNLDNKQIEVDNLIVKSENSIKTLQDKISSITENIDNLKQSMKTVSEKIATKHSRSNKLKSQNLHSKNMDVGSASVGSLSLSGEEFKINPNTNIYIGENKISSDELMKNLKFMSLMKEKCGENLDKCKIQNEQEYQTVLSDEKEILRKLRHLKRDTNRFTN